MKISAVNNVSSLNNKNSSNVSKDRSKTASFGAGAPTEAAKKLPWIARALMYVGQNDGEILNTLVTAFGTAVIAPLFIAGNPLSKEDKETKWYSAMRQPISAVIAMVMQIGVNNAYNGYMQKMASTGFLGEHMNLVAEPEANYLRKIIKLEHPEYNDKQISDEISRRQNIANKSELNKLRRTMANTEITFEQLVDSEAMKEARNEMEREIKATYESELKGLSKKKTDAFIKSHLPEEKVKERALENLRKNIEFETTVKYEIRKIQARFMKNPELADIEKITSEFRSRANELGDDVVEKIVQKLSEAKAYETANGLKPLSSLSTYCCKNNGDITREEVLQNVKIKKMLKVRISNAKKFFKNTKNIGGIVVSMATLPISCGLLNWAYPRVMEKVMPRLQPWIHRDDPDWTPAKAKKYGPPPKVVKVEVEVDDD